MDSFYGGHQGTPFIIKHAFESEDDMIAAFSKGIAFKDVWFGEYCIIDTTNKNDPDNGKIYRRGTEYSQTDGDAVYIGQIVGPAGPAPIVEAKTVNEVITAIKASTKEVDGEEVRYKDYQVYESSSGIYNDDDFWDSSVDPEPKKTELTIDNGGLVSGAESSSIKFAWCNIKYKPGDSGYSSEQSNRVLIGFEIPYVVFKAQAELKSPYDENDKYQVDKITNIDVKPVVDDETNEENPFYQQFKIPVYEGIQGISYVDFNVVSFTGDDNFLYYPEDIIYDVDKGCLFVEGNPVPVGEIAGQQGYVVRVCAYDTYAKPESSKQVDGSTLKFKPSEAKASDDWVDTENEPNPKPNDWKPRVRSVWLYLGPYINSPGGSAAFTEWIIDEEHPEGYYDERVWSRISKDDTYGAVVTYELDDTVDSGITTTNRWWTADYTGKGIITIPDSNQQPADDSGEASGGE